MHIEQITPELTWRLRHEVLYPDIPIYKMWMDEDDDGYHFGAFTENQLVGIVSLFVKGTDYQFRKFAVHPSVQGQGVGRQLLNHIINFSKTEGAERLWCNARVTAIGFYQKSGFKLTGEAFSRGGFDYEIMELML
jgi:GNAT superfamily N-acetyltransferase